MAGSGSRGAVAATARWSSRIAAAALVGVFAFGQATDVITYREHWPCSPYPMYAKSKNDQHQLMEVWGVLANPVPGGATEVRLKARGYVIPIKEITADFGTGKAVGWRKARADMEAFFAHYQKERAARNIRGPVLKGARLYRLTWTLQADAANVETPDQRELLIEVGNTSATRPSTQSSTAPSTLPVNSSPAGANVPGKRPAKGAKK